MTQNQTQNQPNQGNKIGNYLTFIVLIVMILALAAIFIAFDTFFISGDIVTAGILGAIGAIAMSLSVFLLYQSKRQTAAVKIEVPKVMTHVGCTNKGCANDTVREFQRGDYVFKELDVACQKCSGRQMVTAIYKEVKEKEKTYAV